MTDVKALLQNLRKEDPRFDEAQAVVDLVDESGKMLQQMRERANLSQAEMAGRLGISVGRVSQLESGALRHAPSLKTLARYAHACGETVTLAASGEQAIKASREVSPQPDVAALGLEMAALRDVIQALRAEIHGSEQPSREFASGAADRGADPVVPVGSPRLPTLSELLAEARDQATRELGAKVARELSERQTYELRRPVEVAPEPEQVLTLRPLRISDAES